MLRDKSGNKLFRTMKVKVIFPEEIFPDKTFVQHAGPKQGFGPEGVDAFLMSITDQLDTLYPYWEFRAQEMLPEHRTARYLITFAGPRAVIPTNQPQDNPIADSTTPEGETAEATTPIITAGFGDAAQ
jgi:hypothetical protein